MLKSLVTLICCLLATQAVAADDRTKLVGTWKVVSWVQEFQDGGDPRPEYGKNPIGYLVFTPEGRMMAMISYGGRKPLSGDRISSPAPERADAFATFFAYAGRYSVNRNKVVHHVEISSVQNWVNTDMVRLVKFDGDRITLRTPPLSVGGTTQATDLVWERMK